MVDKQGAEAGGEEIIVEDVGGDHPKADPAKSLLNGDDKTVESVEPEGEKAADPFKWPDDWRDQLAGGDEEITAVIKRYGSPRGVAKALKDAQALIRSGKIKQDKPDPEDKAAMAAWRKEQGIPDDPSGYVLPETVKKRITDDDKPALASFSEFAHSKGAPQSAVDLATEWYVNQLEALDEQRVQSDTQAFETAEDKLRDEWAPGEFKANLTLAKRFAGAIPGVGDAWAEARLPDGRKLGNVPEFVTWAADMGRQKFGDVTFANSDSEARHNSRKSEIEKIRQTDFARYEREGLDKEMRGIIEKEMKRK